MIQLMTKTINGNGIKHEALIKDTKELLTIKYMLQKMQYALLYLKGTNELLTMQIIG